MGPVVSVVMNEIILVVRGTLLVIVGLLLIPVSVEDIKKKRVSASLVLLILVISIICFILGIVVRANQNILLVIPGVVALILEKIGFKLMGRADSILIIAMGLLLSNRGYLLGMMVSLASLFLVATIVLILKRDAKNTKLAMLPFVSLGIVIGAIF